MASTNFSNITDHLARAAVNYASDTFKAVLVTSVPTEGNFDSWINRSDVTNEHAATGGYTTGGFSVTASVGAVDTTNNRVPVTFTCASPTYSSATLSAAGCIIYKSTGTSSTDKLLHFVDFGSNVSSTNGNFTVTFSTPLYINR